MPTYNHVATNGAGELNAAGKAAIQEVTGPWKRRASTGADILDALTIAKNDISAVIPPNISTRTGKTIVELPPGDITISEVYGFLGVENLDYNVMGLRFVGAGKSMTRVVYDPADPAVGAMLKNDFWLHLSFEEMTFVTLKAGAVFMDSHTTNHAQGYTFQNVSWSGPWKWVFDLQGNNNNSEFVFIACETAGMQVGGAFIHVGETNTSDQFLNYWFFGFKHWTTSAALLDVAKGGHFHMYGVDVSDYGGDLTTTDYLFKLRGSAHAAGVQSLTVDGLRVEAKNSLCALIFSEWGDGNVVIQCDWSSQATAIIYGDIILINTLNDHGASYHFKDSLLAGGVRVRYGSAAFTRQQIIRFDQCGWMQKMTPSEVVSYDDSSSGSNKARPSVRFDDCRSVEYENPFGVNGASVWDATIGYNYGPLVKAAPKRSVLVRAIYGSLADSDGSMKINLPVGALITGLTAVSPPVNMPDADGGSWSLASTQATPVTIATVTVTGNMSPGFSVRQDLPVPYHCSTRDRATVTLTSNGVLYGAEPTFVTVEGYW